MTRTMDQIMQEQLGVLMFQIARAQAEIEALTEENSTLKKSIEALSKKEDK